MAHAAPYKVEKSGIDLFIRLKPNSHVNICDRCVEIAPERCALQVKIKQPAVENKANSALIKYLANLLDIPQSQLSLLRGLKSRDKTLHIKGEPTDIKERLDRIMSQLEE